MDAELKEFKLNILIVPFHENVLIKGNNSCFTFYLIIYIYIQYSQRRELYQGDFLYNKK